jgi:SNF2 family DNA or RNA helicase
MAIRLLNPEPEPEPNLRDIAQGLSAEEQELLTRLNEIRKQKAQTEAELAQQERAQVAKEKQEWETLCTTQGVPITVESLVENSRGEAQLITRTKFLWGPLLDVLRSTPGRIYDAGANRIPLTSWTQFLEELEKAKTAGKLLYSLSYADGIKEKMDAFNSIPRMEVGLSKDKKKLTFAINKGEDWLARQFEGIQYASNIADVKYALGVSEAHVVWQKLENEPNIAFTDEAREVIEKEIARRVAMDEIALAEDVELPDWVWKLNDGFTLRTFQKKAIRFAELANWNYLNCFQMGLGKTATSIATFRYLDKMQLEGKGKCLVVCPSNLKVNWTREIFKLTGERPKVLFGAEPGRADIKEMLQPTGKYYIINYDILGKKVELFDLIERADGSKLKTKMRVKYPWVEFLNIANFDMVIVDEAHYIKNTDANRSKAARELKAPRTICMTGTPILNRPGELWPMLDMTYPEKFPSYENFLYTYTIDGKRARNVEQLRQTLKGIMLRVTKKEVLKDLPPINRIYEWHELSEQALARYSMAEKGIWAELDSLDLSDPKAQREIPGILAQIQRLKQICAMDKVEATADLALDLSDSDDNGGKVLIFTQYKDVAEAIRVRLADAGSITYHGDKPQHERISIYDRFLADKSLKFFIATWQTAGEGLNLQCANNVVFSDLFWTPANHQQAEERAYGRLADPHPINSYYLIAEGTIEEWIQSILAGKLALIDSIVEGLDTERQTSVLSELLGKMKSMARGRK